MYICAHVCVYINSTVNHSIFYTVELLKYVYSTVSLPETFLITLGIVYLFIVLMLFCYFLN